MFPWAGCALGVFSLLGFIGFFVGAIISIILSPNKAVPEIAGFIEGLMVNFGVLGFAVGLASVLCKHPRKPAAICGMVAGVLTPLAEIILLVVM